MAKKSDDSDTGNKLLWLAGGAAVTAFAYYYVNKHLKEKEELQRLQYAEKQQQLKGGDDE